MFTRPSKSSRHPTTLSPLAKISLLSCFTYDQFSAFSQKTSTHIHRPRKPSQRIISPTKSIQSLPNHPPQSIHISVCHKNMIAHPLPMKPQLRTRTRTRASTLPDSKFTFPLDRWRSVEYIRVPISPSFRLLALRLHYIDKCRFDLK